MKIEYNIENLEETYPEYIKPFKETIQPIIEQIQNTPYPIETIIAGILINEKINLEPIYNKKEDMVKQKAMEYLHNLIIDLDSAHDENTRYNPYSLYG